ncbi:protein with beta tubulin folding factor domain [Cryptosporidium ubiquitum]|uniref:Protein with beta tubulin folding factor domain n=1 Tax=Cryptosporidium ubiquitum TaxID=857276 RepID=A0A1J4MBS1_9CRYT|nr:protein with beta tubulin folding factor domain [Cryptosporidium ubiquitum]OII71666.1 protein with beta tubulin folding factor domain [Cryptosporidium ubiquitum]
MNFILLPNFEIVSQLYVGLEFSEAKFWDEEILFLYISLLREFIGSSRFLNYFQWRDFIFGQEYILGKKCLFRLDSSNVLLKKASNVSVAFWTLKKKLLGQFEVEKLYLFTSDSLKFYWMRLSSIVFLKDFELSMRMSEVLNGGEIDSICQWIDGDSFIDIYEKCQRGQFREYRMAENISICFEMISLFILTQFIFSNQSTQKVEMSSSLYSKESYITIAKFFQRNSATFIKILSLFTKEEKESKYNSVNVPASFEMFFDKVFTYDCDKEQDEHENMNFDFNAIKLEKNSAYKNHKSVDQKKMKGNSIAISEFTINAFNYHIVTDSSGEIQLCILLNNTWTIINHGVLDDYYLVNNVHGGNDSERISYFLSNKVVHSVNFDQRELVHNLNEVKGEIFEIVSEKEEIIDFEARNIIISNSSNLEIYITRSVEYLFIRDCNQCNIYCLDLIANIQIENCKNSFIHTDCMFATLINCDKISIFLHSQFSPILKSSDNIVIGPYNIHCLNRKTSYIISYENNLLTQNWRFPISFLSNFNIIKPEKLFMVELLDTKHDINTEGGELSKFPLPSDYYENFTNRLQILELVRNLDYSSQEEVLNQFVSWIDDNKP